MKATINHCVRVVITVKLLMMAAEGVGGAKVQGLGVQDRWGRTIRKILPT